MMVEPFLQRSDEDAPKANSSGNNGGSSDLFQSFDGLMDDLFDLSPSHSDGSPGSYSTTTSKQHNTNHDNDNDKAEAASSIGTEQTSTATEECWRYHNPSNAVHMHVQENAKLPSLNFPVDRKKHSKSPDIEVDVSKLAESFLSADRRQSYHANYQQVGALSQTTGTVTHGNHQTLIHERRDSLDADVLEAFLADIDPTPLSEIKKRHAAHTNNKQLQQQQKQQQQKQPQQRPTPTAVHKNPPTMLYKRKTMLPIPTKKISPPVSPETKQRQTNSDISKSDTMPPPQPPILKEPELMQSAVATAAALAAARPKTNNVTKNTPVSIHRAFGQKSRYGFGSNHVVPSVPPPPQQRPLPVFSNTTRKVANNTPPPSSSHSPLKDVGHGDAYERKKQRAKDARVKLNESIERLSVAIALAGTQSRERRQQWQDLGDSPFQDTAMQIMADCIDTADSAKKWDRPSFVGSAASLIQGLNAQCEAMMREIMRLREVDGVISAGVPPTTADISTATMSAVSDPGSPHKRTHFQSTNGDDGDDGAALRNGESTASSSSSPSSSKRAKIDYTVKNPLPMSTYTEVTQAVWTDLKLRNKIVEFLDPLSLLRCQRVDKALQAAANQEDVWAKLCTARFGFFNVRQWRAKLDDEDEGIKAQSIALYRSMDRANVMSSFQHEGLFLLGEARLPNKISAWVFLVERSNGETMRSVRRRQDMPGNGTYTTMPIVELRTVVQNTGIINEAVIIREQIQSVDASTRRRGEEMTEVDWDERFRKRVFNLDGTPHESTNQMTIVGLTRPAELCRLRLFESVVFTTFIHAKSCSTNSKFVQRANFTKILVALDSGVTVPLVVPFPRDASHLQH